MVKVLAWPPVAVAARYWTPDIPLNRSRSLLTGKDYLSTRGPQRLLAGLEVPSRRHYGSGYMEALWRLMEGGVHLVRLTACRVPWGATVPNTSRGAQAFGWSAPANDTSWITSASLAGVVSVTAGIALVTVSGLPPSSVVAIPGEFLTIQTPSGAETHMIAAQARSNAAGVAQIRLVSTPSGSGPVTIGTRESGVFRIASSWPKAWRRAGQHDPYLLEFRQVFEAETDGFTEINPWT